MGQDSNNFNRNLGKTTVIFNEANKAEIDFKYNDRLESYVETKDLDKEDNYMFN